MIDLECSIILGIVKQCWVKFMIFIYYGVNICELSYCNCFGLSVWF